MALRLAALLTMIVFAVPPHVSAECSPDDGTCSAEDEVAMLQVPTAEGKAAAADFASLVEGNKEQAEVQCRAKGETCGARKKYQCCGGLACEFVFAVDSVCT